MIEYKDQYSGIRLLGGPKTPPDVSVDDIRQVYENVYDKGDILTTDFTVVGSGRSLVPIISDQGTVGFWYQEGGVTSIDHHFPDPRFWRPISSTNLAIAYANSYPFKIDAPRRITSPVAITHTDADSILAAGILTGILEPDEMFGKAAIAADHTGEENEIADLLMGVEGRRDVAFSMNCLFAELGGGRLPEGAREDLDRRLRRRDEARKFVEQGRFEMIENGVAYGIIKPGETSLPGEFLPRLLPEASVIVLAIPMESDHWEMKTRTGFKFPAGKTLHSLNLPDWGGRWNAGSTNRHGGTANPDKFVKILIDNLPSI